MPDCQRRKYHLERIKTEPGKKQKKRKNGGGIAGQTLFPPLPVLGSMLGSLAGSLTAFSVFGVGKKIFLAFCIDLVLLAWGLWNKITN